MAVREGVQSPFGARTEAWSLADAAEQAVDLSCYLLLAGVGIYFSVLTPTGYEPDKAFWVRVVAILGGMAWVIARIGHARASRSARVDRTLVVLAVVLLGSFVLGTIFSIDPRESSWGSHGRQEGLVTYAAYLIAFVLFLSGVSSWHRRDRLISVFLLGSVPVVAYGLVQGIGYDPMPNVGDPNTLYWPVRSSFGQHIFFGSYLVMLIPFTAMRVVQFWRRPFSLPTGSLVQRESVTGIVALAASCGLFLWIMAVGVNHPALFTLLPAFIVGYVLVLVYLYSLPAAPALEAARGLGWTVLLGAQLLALASTGARGAWLALFAAAPVFVILLAWKLGQRRIWQAALAVTIVGGIFLLLLNIPGGPLQPVRTVSGVSRLANITESGGAGGSAQGRLLIWQGVKTLMTDTPSVGGNTGGRLRDLVGYGPETMHWAFERVYPLKLRVVTSEIWTWDRAHDIYLDLLVNAGILGLLAFACWVLAALWRAVKRLGRESWGTAVVLIPATAAIVGHLMDGAFGLETAVTWVLLGLCVALIAVSPGEPAEIYHSPAPAAAPSATLAGFLLVAALVSIIWSFQDSPALAGAIWLAGLLLAFGLVLAASGVGLPALPRRSVLLVAAGLPILAGLLALGQEDRFLTALIAERDGTTQLAEGQVIPAIQHLQEAASNNGFDPQPFTELGGAYLSLAAQRSDSADQTFVPSNGNIRSVSSNELAVLGRTQLLGLTTLTLNGARDRAPLDPDAYNNLGNAYVQAGEPAQALTEYRRAAALSHENPRYLDQQAFALLSLGRRDAAAADARAALALDPTFWYSYYAAALVAHQQGNSAQARLDAQQALAWVKNFWPSPGQSQIAALQALAQTG